MPSLLIVLLPAAVAAIMFWLPRHRRPAVATAVVIVSAVVSLVCVIELVLTAKEPPPPAAAEEAKKEPAKDKEVPAAPPPRELTRPDEWPKDHPLPHVASNCVACHLTAGQQLTAAVFFFTRSVHDLNEMTCFDCHGGNREVDIKAHEEEFGFIGTKKSAHIQGCTDCHSDKVELIDEGPHHWDWSQRINLEYPMCMDCHGNHDIGNPPEGFVLKNVCLDCHETGDKDFPNLMSVVASSDSLAETMREVRRRRIHEESPIPEEFQEAVTGLRTATMDAVHRSKEIDAPAAEKITRQASELGEKLKKWLEKPAS